MQRDYGDEILMAFVDGELDEATTAEIQQSLTAEGVLAARVALFARTRAQAKRALEPLLEEPVPPALSAAVRKMVVEARREDSVEPPSATVVSLTDRKKRRPQAPWWSLPLAASLAAIVAGAAGYSLSMGERTTPHLDVAGLTGPGLTSALAQLKSGEEVALAENDARLRTIATFRDNSGALCREFEVDTADTSTVISVVCRQNEQWVINFAVVAPGADGGYAPASSMEALDAYLSTIGAGQPLSAEEEAAALQELQEGAG
jgi:anti-sigma factor RsiW